MPFGTRLCASLSGPSYSALSQQIETGKSNYADLLEWRLDLLETWDFNKISALFKSCSLPSIFTLRPIRQGGSYSESEEKRLKIIEQLIALQPHYIDLESDVSPKLILKLKKHYPQTRIISSYHNFKETPSDLFERLKEMKKVKADFYKITTQANSTVDALRFLQFLRQSGEQLIGLCMGEYGQLTRLVGPLFQVPITYAAINTASATALGQIPLQELRQLYRTHQVNASTAVYGLIGDPVSKSVGHLTHNFAFQQLDKNAIYLKMAVRSEELTQFFDAIRILPIGGLSVTMPLKEFVMEYLDQIDPIAREIGAVNTLCFKDGKTFGYNTDGLGALNALEAIRPVKGKTLVILGSGGASRAAIYEAKKRGAHVWIANRTWEKAKTLATEFKCEACQIDNLPCYDFIVNATPANMPIAEAALLPEAVVMDMTTHPKITPFLEAARLRGCTVVPGYKMFAEQAAGQFHLWFGMSRSLTYPLIHQAAELAL